MVLSPHFKILWVVLLISILFSLSQAWKRHVLEESNRGVEIVLDEDGFLDLCQKEALPIKATLLRFRNLGVTAIAPGETTLEKLHQDGSLFWISGTDLKFFRMSRGLPDRLIDTAPDSFEMPLRPPYFVVFTEDENLHRWLLYSLSVLLGENRARAFPKGFVVYGKWDDLSQLGLGIYPERIKGLAALGFSVDPRIANRDEIDRSRTTYLLENAASLPNVSTVIFSGLRNEVLGYDPEIPVVAEFLSRRGIRFGYVEAYDAAHVLKGSRALAEKIPDMIVKVQSLSLPPFARLDVEKAVDTFLLGVRDRNVRVVYFRPFLTNFGGVSLLKMNLDFLESLRDNLRRDRFFFSPARPLPKFYPSSWGVLILGFGIFAATFLLLFRFLEIPAAWVWGSAVLFAFFWFAVFHLGKGDPLRVLLGVWGANLFPVLGIVLFSSRHPMSFRSSVGALSKITGVTLAGGFLISALLSDNLTLLGVETFRGVKLLFVIPVLLAPWLAWLYHTRGERFRNGRQCLAAFLAPLQEPLRVSHGVVLLVAALVGLFMLLRSGNVVPEGVVPEWERTLRNFLETALGARPRFKEFLIGHPFLILAATLGLQRRWALPLLLFGALGQADIMDSFAHLHTPLRMTLLRTFHGLWIGILIGGLLQIFMKKIRHCCR